jgi:hypothetical protein
VNRSQRAKLYAAINGLTREDVAAIVKQEFPRAKGAKIDKLAKAAIANAHRQVSPRNAQRG